MNYELQNTVQSELTTGERLLWSDQPDPKRVVLRRETLWGLLFAVGWTAFSIFWVYGAAGFKVPDFSKIGHDGLFPLFGVPFVLIGLWMLSSPYRAYRKALKTVYAVTDKRCLIIHAVKSKTVASYGAADIGNIEKREQSDGAGDLIFSREVHTDKEGNRNINKIGFLGISNVRMVEQLVRETFKKGEVKEP